MSVVDMTPPARSTSRASDEWWMGLPSVRDDRRPDALAHGADPQHLGNWGKDHRLESPDSPHPMDFAGDTRRHTTHFAIDQHPVDPLARDRRPDVRGHGADRHAAGPSSSRRPPEEDRCRTEEGWRYTRGYPSMGHHAPDFQCPSDSPLSSGSLSGSSSAHLSYPSFPSTPTSALPPPACSPNGHGQHGPGGGYPITSTSAPVLPPLRYDRNRHGPYGPGPGGHPSSSERLPGIWSLLSPEEQQLEQFAAPPQLADLAAARPRNGMLTGAQQQSGPAPTPAATPATTGPTPAVWQPGGRLGGAEAAAAETPGPAPSWWQTPSHPGGPAAAAEATAASRARAAKQQGKRPGRKNFTQEQREPMEAYARRAHRGGEKIPLPSGEALRELMEATGLQPTQIINFITNFRRRQLKHLAPVWALEDARKRQTSNRGAKLDADGEAEEEESDEEEAAWDDGKEDDRKRDGGFGWEPTSFLKAVMAY